MCRKSLLTINALQHKLTCILLILLQGRSWWNCKLPNQHLWSRCNNNGWVRMDPIAWSMQVSCPLLLFNTALTIVWKVGIRIAEIEVSHNSYNQNWSAYCESLLVLHPNHYTEITFVCLSCGICWSVMEGHWRQFYCQVRTCVLRIVVHKHY